MVIWDRCSICEAIFSLYSLIDKNNMRTDLDSFGYRLVYVTNCTCLIICMSTKCHF
jgi:hypothetical protein